MARKRMIDPSIWTDEGMAELSIRQQLLYVALISNADDAGRLKGSAAALRLVLPTIYPGTAFPEIDADLRAVLAVMSKLVRYEAEGHVYLAFHNYRAWQQIQHPTESKLPPPPPPSQIKEGALNEDSVSAHGAVQHSIDKVSLVSLVQLGEGDTTSLPSTPPAAPKVGEVALAQLEHKATKLYQTLTKQYPNQPARAAIVQAVPETQEALDKWRQVITTAELRNIKRGNVECLLDWFRDGIPPGRPGDRARPAAPVQLPRENAAEWFAAQDAVKPVTRDPRPPLPAQIGRAAS